MWRFNEKISIMWYNKIMKQIVEKIKKNDFYLILNTLILNFFKLFISKGEINLKWYF